MANAIKYSLSAQTLALNKGNMWIGVRDVSKYPTSSTDYWNGIIPPSSGYTVYLGRVSQGPIIYTTNSDAELISLTNTIGSQSFSTIGATLDWYNTQSDKIVVNIDYPPIITSGMVLNLDAGFTPSYPTTGTTWYDVSTYVNNGIMMNGPTYSSANGGVISLDGIDDYVNLGNTSSIKMGVSDFTISVWIKILTQNGVPTFRGLITSKTAPAANAGYGFYWNDNVNKFLWSTANGTLASEIFTTNTWTNLINTWANVVMVRQSGTTNNGCFYINGLYQSLSSSATILNVDTINNMNLGNTANFSSNYWFKGTYGPVQIYNRALSSTEVLQNYQSMFPRFLGANIVTSGLVLYLDAGYIPSYPTTGTTWNNVSGVSGGTGTLTNGPTYSSANGGSIVFDGVDDYVLGTSNLGISGDATFSICYWAIWDGISFSGGYPSGVGNNSTGVTNQGLSTTWYAGRIALDFWANRFRADNPLLVQTWYYVCFTKTPGLINSTSKLYANSINLPGTYEGINTIPNITDSPLIVGRLDNTRLFNGKIANVQIYNRALSQAEITQNYNAQKARFGL